MYATRCSNKWFIFIVRCSYTCRNVNIYTKPYNEKNLLYEIRKIELQTKTELPLRLFYKEDAYIAELSYCHLTAALSTILLAIDGSIKVFAI